MTLNTTETITSFLERILDSVHPLMAEGLYLAAVPNWYDEALFAVLRNRDDGRNSGLIERLAKYSFVVTLQGEEEGETLFAVRPDERLFLQRRWIAKDPQAYRDAHERALGYRKENPDPNPFAQAQNRLYHQLFVDLQAGMDYLTDRFRAYHNERQLAAIDRLLDTVEQARFYLVMLDVEALPQLDDLLAHLHGRIGQLRGQWRESLDGLQTLRQKTDLAPWLMPYVARAYGYALAHTGKYVEAIEQYEFALDLFNKQAATITNTASVQAERAHTMIALGSAHVDLATSIRGHHERVLLEAGGVQRLRGFFHFFLSLPLVFYLSLFLGRRVWQPRFWPTLIDLDWIVARLAAKGAKLYATADPILEAHGTPAEGLVADEQLARLYLTIGDAEQARLLFSRLLAEEETPLGDYRRGAIRVRLADALLGLGEPQMAGEHLEAALPVLALYQDSSLLAEAELLLGKARAQSGDSNEAVPHLQRALASFHRQGNEVMVTEAAERLEALLSDPNLEERQRELALATADGVTDRCYLVRYRDPATILFHRATLGLMVVLIFLIFVSIIRLETGIAVEPVITFNASPLLRSDAPDFTPELSQGVVALNIAAVPNPQVLLWLGVLLFGTYLVLSTTIGILAIIRTSLTKVQARARAQVVRLDGDRVRVGEGANVREIRLTDVTHIYRADLRFVDKLMIDDSTTTLIANEGRIIIRGTTAWYSTLQKRILALAADTTQVIDYGYSLLRSRMGGLFLATLVALILLSLSGRFAARFVTLDIPGLRYSLADLYPYLYMGMVIPPVWWFVIQPLRIRFHSQPGNILAWLLGGAGVVFAVMRVITRFRPWATIPDIYSPLLVLTLVLSAGAYIWRVEHPGKREALFPTWIRTIVPVAAIAISFLMALNLWRELGAYHAMVNGDFWRDRSFRQGDEEQKTASMKRAVDSYGRAIQLSQIKLLGFDSRSAIGVPMGIPSAESFTWARSLNNRAALTSQLADYQLAIEDYSDLIDHVNASAEMYADRAMAYQGAGTTPGDEMGEVDVAEQNYDAALADLDQAIALDPSNAKYYLWRGVTYHALGNETAALENYEQALSIEGKDALDASGQAQALVGEGWIAFVNEDYRQAADLFQMATEADAGSLDAYLALGYAHYSLRQYREALGIWEQAAEKDPSNPIAFISLGTLYWRVATLGEDYDATGIDRCSSATVPQADKRRSARQLESSVEYLGRSTTIQGQEPEDVAFTYRTMGQVQFLLRNCPGADAVEVLEEAVGYYGEAIKLDQDNAQYWHMRGRLSYVIWLNSPPGSGPVSREWLFQALADQERASELNPVDAGGYRPNAWRVTIYDAAVNGTLAEGDRRFAAGEYALAQAYYELVATNRPDHIQAAFSAGLAAIANGDQQQAGVWYEAGIERALAVDDVAAVQAAQEELQVFANSRSEIDISSLENLFSERGLDMGRPLSASVAFDWAMAALEQGDIGEATELYEQGLILAADTSEMATAASALMTLTARDPSRAIRPSLASVLPRLEQAVSSNETNVEEAYDLALIALMIGDHETAGRWYNEGVRRSAVENNYPPLRATRASLRTVWESTVVSSDGILTQMERQLPAQLNQYPDLAESGLYWRFRSWFKYGLGLSAFRLGDEEAARNALLSGQADSEIAYDLDPTNNAYVQSYLVEGAWGWYHVERGNAALAAGNTQSAQADYEAAVAAYAPVSNGDARNEIGIASFKAGLAALLLDEPERAREWYKFGLSTMSRYEADDSVLELAIDELGAVLANSLVQPAVGEAILSELEEAR